MDGLDLLKDDHRKVEKLLEQMDSTTEDDVSKREHLFRELTSEMQAHEIIEEEILYPALQEHPKAKEIVLEGYEEHHVVDTIMNELNEVPFDDERWSAKFSVMKENIEHHIEEEEEEMFEQAENIFDATELEELGARMQERKKELASS
ncbi:MAG: hemerythrin domain-containing protein [Actinomycetota bacterium]|nr:hemerythrin domain-containing protein [Actinomycetota bacterium]